MDFVLSAAQADVEQSSLFASRYVGGVPARDSALLHAHHSNFKISGFTTEPSLEEMAAIAGMGTTLFNEKVKNYSGFTPLNYLINIRISEAIKLLKKKDVSITDIALDTGFYSSQHFSTTFKKLTGYTPSEFRKNNLLHE